MWHHRDKQPILIKKSKYDKFTAKWGQRDYIVIKIVSSVTWLEQVECCDSDHPDFCLNALAKADFVSKQKLILIALLWIQYYLEQFRNRIWTRLDLFIPVFLILELFMLFMKLWTIFDVEVTIWLKLKHFSNSNVQFLDGKILFSILMNSIFLDIAKIVLCPI